MKGTGTIHEGLLYLDKDLHNYVAKNNESECFVEIRVINTPQQYLYDYLFGYLIKDIAEHSGETEEDIKQMMKEKFATYKVDTWLDIPKRYRSKCQR